MNPLVRLLLAALIALAALIGYNRYHIDAENFALGAENQAAFESWNGRRITAATPRDIAELIEHEAKATSPATPRPRRVLWLGNSQLHAINQFRTGDHLGPYWLAESCDCDPLGISLPNASLQEHLVLTHTITARLPVSAVVVKLVFDDLREDGLRDDLAPMLSTEVRQSLGQSDIGAALMRNWDEKSRAGGGADKTKGLEGFAQKYVEDQLVDGLAALVPLWADRPHLRSRLFADLYDARNWALGITPSTVRRVIKLRFEKNMRAFEALIEYTRKADVPLLVYIAPIRQDVPLPYEVEAYRRWVADVARIAADRGFRFLNLERLVPAHQWGSVRKGDIDFMHFQGSGHKLLADALHPEVQRLLAREQVSRP
jgi:hypothetical protein